MDGVEWLPLAPFLARVNLQLTDLPLERRVNRGKFNDALTAQKFSISVQQFGHGTHRFFKPTEAHIVAEYFRNPDRPGSKSQRWYEIEPFAQLPSPITRKPLGEMEFGDELDAWLHASFGYTVDWKQIDVPHYSRDTYGWAAAHQECIRKGYRFAIAGHETAAFNVRHLIAWLFYQGKEWSQREEFRKKAAKGEIKKQVRKQKTKNRRTQ